MQFSVMAENPIQHLQGQIPAFPFALNLLKESNTLYVMEKLTDAM
jgi:hypothetical protein